MIAPLFLAAQIDTPQLQLLSPPQAGTTLVYDLSGTATSPGIPEFLLLDFTLLPLPVAVDPFGVLQIALTPLLQIVPSNGASQFAVPIPGNPNFAGLTIHAQGFGFVFDGQSGVNQLSNLVSTTLTAPAPQPRFLIAANEGDQTLDTFVIDEDSGHPRRARVVLLDAPPLDLAASPSGARLFVLEAGQIETFNVAPGDGSLAPLASTPLPAGSQASDLMTTPGGNRLYLTDEAQDQVHGWGVNGDGTLTPLTGSPYAVAGTGSGAQGPVSLAIDAQGRFLCVANRDSDSVSVFELQPSGALANERTTGVGNGPSSITTLYQDGSEPVVLVSSRDADSVTSLQLAADGTPSLAGVTSLAVGSAPTSIRAARFGTGDRVFVSNEGTGTIDTVILTAQGQLSVPTSSLFGLDAREVEVSPELGRAYALFRGEHELATGALAPDTGALTPSTPQAAPGNRIRTRDLPVALELINGTAFAQMTTDRVYSVTRLGTTVEQFAYNSDSAVLSPLNPSSASITGEPNDACVHPTLDFLYVGSFLNGGGSDLQVFDISNQGATLPTQVLDLGGSGHTPVWTVDADPTGSLVVAVLSTVPGEIVPLRVGVAGALTALSSAPAGSIPRGADFDPTGRFYYAANSLDNTLIQYDVDPVVGSITPMSPALVPAGNGVVDVACEPSGRYAYATNSVAGALEAYSIDAASGALTRLPASPIALGTRPASIAVHPDGGYLVVADETVDLLHILRIDLDTQNAVVDGTPQAIGQLPLAARSRGLRFSADGEQLFVSTDEASGGDRLTVLDFDDLNGTLTFQQDQPTPDEPRGVATRDRVD